MRTVPTKPGRSSKDMKRAIIPFKRADPKPLERGQFHTYKLRTTPADPTSPIYELSLPFFEEGSPEEWILFRRGLTAVLKGQNITTGPPSYAVAKTLLRGDALTVFEQAEIARGTQTMPHYEKCLDDVAEHVFPEKAGQIQKRYMRRNIHFSKDYTVKAWVARVKELNGYLKDFPDHNGTATQPLDPDELMDILEYGVPASWRREFTVQGFDPVDQGIRKFVEFCTRLELCVPSGPEPKVDSSQTSKAAGKRKAEVSTTSTSSAGGKFYCELHGQNKTHHTKDCFEMKRRAKRAKTTPEDGKIAYKDLNAFVNAKVTAALKKAHKERTEKKAKKVTINAFDKFRSLNVDDSSDEESDHDVNALAEASDHDSDSDNSRVPSEDSDSDDE